MRAFNQPPHRLSYEKKHNETYYYSQRLTINKITLEYMIKNTLLINLLINQPGRRTESTEKEPYT